MLYNQVYENPKIRRKSWSQRIKDTLHRGTEIRISEETMQTRWQCDYVYLYGILEKAKF